MAVLGLCCCPSFSLTAVSGGYSLVAVQELLIEVASRCRAWALAKWTSVVTAHGLSICDYWALVPCGIFPDQGSSPCLPHWQVDSLPLSPLGSL